MQHVLTMCAEAGHLYIEVPNIAYWPKRVEMLLRGTTPLVPIGVIYAAREPFIGHCHEYTLAELRALCELSGLELVEEFAYNYSQAAVPGSPAAATPGLVSRTMFRYRPETREVLSVLARRRRP